MTGTTTIIRSGDEVEIVEHDDQGAVIRRTYGRIERPPYVPAPGTDPERFGWTEDDVITIGELPPD